MGNSRTTPQAVAPNKDIPSTGWPALDAHLDRLDAEGKAALWAVLKTRNLDVMDNAQDRLAAQIELDAEDTDQPAPIRFWLTLPQAAQIGADNA